MSTSRRCCFSAKVALAIIAVSNAGHPKLLDPDQHKNGVCSTANAGGRMFRRDNTNSVILFSSVESCYYPPEREGGNEFPGLPTT